MYNHKFNQQWIDKLRRRVEGKRILFVGNAATMFSRKYGEMIDDYDFVVRFGKGVPYTEFKEYLGRKTDLWFFGTGRAGMYKQFSAPFKIYTMSQLSLYKKSGSVELAIHPDMASGKFQVYRDFFLAGSTDDIMRCNKEINNGTPEARISQGAQCIHFFHNIIETYSKIELIGFDFFANEFKYNYKTDKKNIPKIQPTTSWHMPLISRQYSYNPHNVNSNEERYIRAVPNLIVHEMPPLDMVKIEEVLKRLRGNNASIEEKTND